MTEQPNCRFCATPLTHTFVDLGATPLANAYVTPQDVAAGRDKAFSLHARVCSQCLLVQVDDSGAAGRDLLRLSLLLVLFDHGSSMRAAMPWR